MSSTSQFPTFFDTGKIQYYRLRLCVNFIYKFYPCLIFTYRQYNFACILSSHHYFCFNYPRGCHTFFTYFTTKAVVFFNLWMIDTLKYKSELTAFANLFDINKNMLKIKL